MSLKDKVKNMKRKDGTCIWEPKEKCVAAPDKLEYNDKGYIKRDGFKMGKSAINYGEDFEKEHFDEIFKPLMIFLVCFLLAAGVLTAIALKFLLFP